MHAFINVCKFAFVLGGCMRYEYYYDLMLVRFAYDYIKNLNLLNILFSHLKNIVLCSFGLFNRSNAILSILSLSYFDMVVSAWREGGMLRMSDSNSNKWIWYVHHVCVLCAARGIQASSTSPSINNTIFSFIVAVDWLISINNY